MNLYFIDKIIQDVMDQTIDYTTGEITEEGAKRLEALGLQKDQIIDNMIKAYKNQQMIVDGIDAEMKRLSERKAVLSKTKDSIMKQLSNYLTEGEKIVTPEYELKWTTSTKVDGLDGFDPELSFNDPLSDLKSFVIKKVPDPVYSFDKKAIMEELKKEKPKLPLDVFINKTKNPKIK